MSQIARKWRPTLAMIVYAVLLTVLAVPAALVVLFRLLNGSGGQFSTIESVAVLATLAITLVVGFVFVRTITGPIDALIRTTRAIRTGGKAAIVAPEQQGTREIAVLSQSFLELASRLVERSDYVQTFAAHVSHELKSPLTAIKGSAELLRDAEMSPEERKRFLDHIIADSDRLASLLDRLRALARAEQPLDGGGATLSMVAEALRQRQPGLAIVASGAVEERTMLSTEAAVIIFGHMADNAAQHGARRLTLAADRIADRLQVLVADDGSGIAPGNRGQVFQPFFTTRREQGGTGMGLDIARSMLQTHGGNIALVSSDTGAAFEVTVPLLG